ncbi:plasmid mobilization relaxosome protein MobC [Streptomyces kanamyceticus]|uniref:Plasmid mobilization relaxosome protein MobC n=2 Tax=Streptomyces kanamyceticus TaxID=1967 RepID=A0A5J6GNB0_STRKN|nr:plasmid mobilization relaxosome protein MobC [Streptomyces kanamyceticus]
MTIGLNSAASCRVRSPYPTPAPEGAGASGAEAAPESAGPGGPTAEGGAEPSSSVPQQPAPRRRLRDKQLRERRVHPRYNDDEFTLVKSAAALSGMAAGGYVAECSLAAARSDDPTAAVADYRSMIKALMAANGKLGQIGNNLNQLTHHLNKDGAWPHPATVQRLLDRVEATVAKLDTAIAQVTEGR